MAHIRLLQPFHNRKPGDVVDIPAVIARDLQKKQIGHGGAIDTSNVKDVDFNVPTPERVEAEPGVETVEPKKSQDFSVADLQEMDLSDKDEAFFEGDNRKTVQKMR